LPAQGTLGAAVVDGGRRRRYVASSERREQAYCSIVLPTLVLQGASTRGVWAVRSSGVENGKKRERNDGGGLR